ncbi:UDP binding domain-containing protein, partial [Methylobacterium oxalidis]
DAGTPVRLVETVVSVNESRKRAMARKIIAACGGQVRGRTIALLGLTFKPNTDDMRDAPSLSIVAGLQDAGARVRAYDPEGMEQARPLLPDIGYAADPYDCAEGADALVLVTEWDAFRALDFDRLKAIMAEPVVVDLRNVYWSRDIAKLGFSYTAIGQKMNALVE